MRLQYYIDEEGENVVGLWIPKRCEFIDVSAKEGEIWAAMLPGSGAKKLRKEIETWISQGAKDGIPVEREGLSITSALHVLPGTIACLGKTYASHAREFSGDEPNEPSIFLKSVSAVSSELSCVICPKGAEKLDYEVELAAVIGETLHGADEATAGRAIMGYTVMCDYSERAWQLERGGQWTKGKSCDTFAPFGPVFVTRDEIPNPNNLHLSLKVNGKLRQKDTTSSLMWSVPRLVSYVSQFMTLNPGDVVSTGTPGGVGMGMNPPQYLRLGDIIEWGCDEIGYVRQTVEEE